MNTITVTIDGLAAKIIREPHALIAGTTGSGKSTMMDTIMYAINGTDGTIYSIIDLKINSLRTWDRFYKCKHYAETMQQAIHVLDEAISMMNYRNQELKKIRKRQWTGGDYYIVIDEAAELMDGNREVKEKLKSILRMGRSTNIHVLLSTQAPSRKVLSADVMLNIGCRLGLRCKDPIESRQIIGTNDCCLLPRYGEGYFVSPEYLTPLRVVINMTSDEKIDELYDKMHVRKPVAKPRTGIMKWLFG